jgi:hypothetical protein
MASRTELDTRFAKKRKATLWIMVVSSGLLIAVCWAMLSARPDTGDRIIRYNVDGGVHVAEDVRAALQLLMDAYSSVITLVSASFGVVAFLITVQQNQKSKLTSRAWGVLIAGVIFLAAALILAFVGREILLTMLTSNAVEIALPALTIARWLSYGCIVVAAILIALFAVEAAISPSGGQTGIGAHGAHSSVGETLTVGEGK